MKILFIIATLEGGGAQKLLSGLALRINQKDRCEILALSAENDRFSADIRKNGTKCTFIPDTVKGITGKLKYMDAYIRNGRFDLIHAHLFPALYYGSVLKRFRYRSVPFIYTEHSTDNRRRHRNWLRPLEQWMYAPYEKIVSISEDTRSKLIKWIRVRKQKKRKFAVIHNGIPLDEYRNAKPYEREKILPGIEKDDVLLCMTGSFTEQKNHRFMVEVMKKLPRNYKLMCLGEGVLQDEIKELVIRSDLKDRIFFMGFHKDAACFMKTSDIAVIPSKREGFGLAAVEAMACGKPVVCSDVPGLSDVVGQAGVKIKNEDTAVFAESIIKEAGRKDLDEKIDKLQKQADLFDIESTVRNYLNLYHCCIRRKR